MIKPVTMYSVICDRCGKTFIDEFNGIVAWVDEGTAKEQAMESEWALDHRITKAISLIKKRNARMSAKKINSYENRN